MRLRTSALLGLLVTTVGGLALEACRSPTQVTLDIRTDVPCSSLREVGIVVSEEPRAAEQRVSSSFYAATTSMCDRGSVGTLVLTPGDTGRGAVIVIAGIDRPAAQCNAEQGYFGCIVARRSFAFVDHTPLTLPIALTLDCKNVPCDAVSTCAQGQCVSSEVACSGAGCEEPTADGGIDASTSDAPSTIDAPIDAPRTDSGDAAPDAPVGSPLVCTQGSGATVACNAPTGACCYSNDVVNCIADGGSCGWSVYRCVGSANCGAGSKCCSVDVYTGASDRLNTQCQAGGCGTTDQICEQDGECTGGKTCKPLASKQKSCQ